MPYRLVHFAHWSADIRVVSGERIASVVRTVPFVTIVATVLHGVTFGVEGHTRLVAYTRETGSMVTKRRDGCGAAVSGRAQKAWTPQRLLGNVTILSGRTARIPYKTIMVRASYCVGEKNKAKREE